ncbi:MAG: hypothetical protein GTO18_14450 [Anaerolineales bacterium]|nr:hypothetical protein [Anaerolineales bacterium]
MSDRIYAALEVCLEALDTGVELDKVLTLYPDIQQELRPALEGAIAAHAYSNADVPTESISRSRTHVLGYAAQMRGKGNSFSWFGLPRLVTGSLIAFALVILSAATLLTASAQAIPGDRLYPLKRTAEQVSLSVAPSQSLKRSLQKSYAKRRTDETKALLLVGRNEPVTFEGVVNTQTNGSWIVDDIRVELTPDTNIIGRIEVGMGVDVSGEVLATGSIAADTIRLRTFRLSGPIEAITPSSWTISGMSILLNELTLIDNGIRIGEHALVLVQVDDEGSYIALAILRVDDLIFESNQEKPSEPTETQSLQEEIEFTGQIEWISGQTWRIGGLSIKVTPDTEIEEIPQIGDSVKVHAILNEDGSLTAREIELLDGHEEGENHPGEEQGDDEDIGDDTDDEENDAGEDSSEDDDSSDDHEEEEEPEEDEEEEDETDEDTGR